MSVYKYAGALLASNPYCMEQINIAPLLVVATTAALNTCTELSKLISGKFKMFSNLMIGRDSLHTDYKTD